jgi:hypothetical protein
MREPTAQLTRRTSGRGRDDRMSPPPIVGRSPHPLCPRRALHPGRTGAPVRRRVAERSRDGRRPMEDPIEPVSQAIGCAPSASTVTVWVAIPPPGIASRAPRGLTWGPSPRRHVCPCPVRSVG